MVGVTPAILPGANDHDKLQALSGFTYKQQAVWFMNGFWELAQKDAERLWNYVNTMGELDLELHADGNGLDEVNAHRFLEKYNETLTVRELRDKLRSTGALSQQDRPKAVPLVHFLLFKYDIDWHKLVNASQGDNSAEIAEAQRLLDSVKNAFAQADAAHQEAVARANAAAAKEAEAKRQEAPFKAAQEEVESALAEVKKQESEYQGKIADCNKRSEEGGVVQKNKAKAELAQLLAEDPLPLSRAKITLEAAKKRAERARAPFEAATNEAVAARQVADNAKQAAEDALNNAKSKVKEAEDYLEEIKRRPGCAQGALWWIDRELHEAKKYKPTSRGGIAK